MNLIPGLTWDDIEWLVRRLEKKRKDAKNRKIGCRLNLGHLVELYALYRKGCPRCGLEFTKKYEQGAENPQYPTIDRINPDLDYVVGNVQFLCTSCNDQKLRDVRRYPPIGDLHDLVHDLWLASDRLPPKYNPKNPPKDGVPWK